MTAETWIYVVRPEIIKLVESLVTTLESAALLLLGSLVIAKVIENYKAHHSLRVALATKRAEKIDYVSMLLFEAEEAIQGMARTMAVFEQDRGKGEDYSFTEWSKKYQEVSPPIELVKKKAYDAIRASYYMLGPKLSLEFLGYHRLLDKYSLLMDSKDFLNADKVLKEIDSLKPSVIDFIKHPDE